MASVNPFESPFNRKSPFLSKKKGGTSSAPTLIKGRDGIDGKDGLPGERGRAGPVGPRGMPGIDGKDGRDGKDGVDGRNGLNGKDGKNGKDGRNGKDGEAPRIEEIVSLVKKDIPRTSGGPAYTPSISILDNGTRKGVNPPAINFTNATLTKEGQQINVDVGGGSPLTTKGDIFTYGTADARLGVGADTQVLTADSTEATGIKWAVGGDVTAGTVMTDHSVVRGDGGAKGVQDSGVLIDDSDNLSGITNITLSGTVDGRDVAADGTVLDGITTGLTSGSVPFSNGTTLIEDNANLFWDDTNNRLGIGTATPEEQTHLLTESGNGTAYHQGFSGSPTGDGIVRILKLYSARGTAASPAASVGDNAISQASAAEIQFAGSDQAGGERIGAKIELTADPVGATNNGTWSSSGHSAGMSFWYTPTNSNTLTRGWTISSDGSLRAGAGGGGNFRIEQSGALVNIGGNINVSSNIGIVYVNAVDNGFLPSDGSVIAAHIGHKANVRIDIDSNNDSTTSYFVVGNHHLLTNTSAATNALFAVHENGGAHLGYATVSTPTAMLDINCLAATRVGLELKAAASQTANLQEWQDSSGTVLLSVQADGDLEFDDGTDIVFDTTTGTQIGTATSQKLSFFGATPIVQPTEITDELTTVTHTAPGTPDYAVQDLVDSGVGSAFGFATKDEGNTVLSVIANLQARVNELEDVLSSLGLLADAD